MPPIKKIVVWLIVIFLGYAVLTQPNTAAEMVRSAWDIAFGGVRNIFTFFSQLLKGG